MAGVRIKVESVERDVKLTIDQLLSPKAQAQQFAESAKLLLDEADAENKTVLGRIPRSRTWVDGREGAALENVKPDGVIVREYDLVIDVLRFIADQLYEVSPVLTGFYRDHHTLFADGTEVGKGETIPDAREYVFINDVIYARKIEGVWRPPQSKQAPQGVYEFVVIKAQKRFGNLASVYFTWRSPVSGALLSQKESNKNDRRQSRFPAIVVTQG